MKTNFTFLLLAACSIAIAQNFKEKELKTEIKEVTIFLNGAQVFESGGLMVPNGNTILKVKGLSPFIDEKSIQVKSEGDFTILSVNHKLNYLNELKKDEKIDSLKKLIEGLDMQLSREEGRLEVLREKQSLLNENKKLGTQNSGASIIQLKQAIEFYETEISKIKEDEIKSRKIIELKGNEKAKFQQQLKQLN